MTVVVTLHAAQRYAEHHGAAPDVEIAAALAAAEPVGAELARTMVGRRPGAGRCDDEYRLARDRRGLFVVNRGRLVTYLRFGPSQEAFARKHWPERDGAT